MTAKTGDVLTIIIDGLAIPYTVAAGDTLAKIAANIATAINNTNAPDPFSGLPLNSLVLATSAASVITLAAANSGAPFSLTCALESSWGTYAAGTPLPARQTAEIAGTVTTGDVLTTTINNLALPYTVGSSDTTITILANRIVSMINGSMLTDQASGLPLNDVVLASNTVGVITLTAKDPTTPFTLQCATSSNTETYTQAGPFPASQTAEIFGSFAAGAVLTTNINGIRFPILSSRATIRCRWRTP